jgi:hypothetical protein
MTPLDPRMRTALQDDRTALGLLNELHQQILMRAHPSVLSGLLGKYVAIAAGRSSAATKPSAAATESDVSRLTAMISSIMKSAHEMAP